MSTIPFDYALRRRVSERAAIGLLALSTDATIESEWRRLLTLEGVEFYVARVPASARVTPETLLATEQRLHGALDGLIPDSPLDVVAYACTSATLVIGEAQVAAALWRSRPGVDVTTPLGAAKAAIAALGLRAVAVLTPYTDTINERLREHLLACGIEITALGSFQNEHDPEVVRISPNSVAEAVRSLARRPGTEGVFVACTALRGSELIPALENELGVAVTSSNHALAWHALRLAGVSDCLPDAGRLFRLPLPETPD